MDWSDVIIFKEVDFVYIVNGKRFLTKKEAEDYLNKKQKRRKGYGCSPFWLEPMQMLMRCIL